MAFWQMGPTLGALQRVHGCVLIVSLLDLRLCLCLPFLPVSITYPQAVLGHVLLQIVRVCFTL